MKILLAKMKVKSLVENAFLAEIVPILLYNGSNILVDLQIIQNIKWAQISEVVIPAIFIKHFSTTECPKNSLCST